ncbi:hypothetical protein [Flavobacterium johnsoniae]|uniref:hypothetical protein n=1 Tax=Flavobacterium johnsoniae TaxID=986 RepID=UPI003D978E20
MKTIFFKNAVPFAVAVLGISGAFVTTSMQSSSKALIDEPGYTLNSANMCDEEVSCGTHSNQICRLNGETGPQAFGKNAAGNCNRVLYQPEP